MENDGDDNTVTLVRSGIPDVYMCKYIYDGRVVVVYLCATKTASCGRRSERPRKVFCFFEKINVYMKKRRKKQTTHDEQEDDT